MSVGFSMRKLVAGLLTLWQLACRLTLSDCRVNKLAVLLFAAPRGADGTEGFQNGIDLVWLAA